MHKQECKSPLKRFENHSTTEMTAGWPTEPLTPASAGLNEVTTQQRRVCVELMRGRCGVRPAGGARTGPVVFFLTVLLQDSAPHLDLCRSTSAGSDADLGGSLELALDRLRGASERDFLRLGLVDCTLLESESERKSSATIGGRKQRSMAAGFLWRPARLCGCKCASESL